MKQKNLCMTGKSVRDMLGRVYVRDDSPNLTGQSMK